VIKHCLSVNEAFLEPLPYSEIKATSRSIAEYCWKKDGYFYQEFIDRQKRKGSLGGVAKASKYAEKRNIAKELKEQGFSYTEISEKLDCSRRSAITWCK
jgi:hypothetical protein